MTPEEKRRHSEADSVESVYAWALTQIGVSAVAEAYEAWESNPPTGGVATRRAWLALIKRLLRIRGEWATELALPYYRLVRALRTGATIEAEGLKNEDVTLEDLREEFNRVVEAVRQQAQEAPPAPEPTQAAQLEPVTPSREPRTPARSDAGSVDESQAVDDENGPENGSDDVEPDLVEEVADFPVEVDTLDEDVDDVIDRIFDDLEAEIEEAMDRVGPSNYEGKIVEIEPSEPVDKADAKKAAAYKKARARQMAEAERIAMHAARGLTYNLASIDRKALGWIRHSKTGTPCGWCAMLISQGFVEKNSSLYRSKKSAGGVVGEEFHTNCHCVAVPIFFKEQLTESPLFELNRQYGEEWPVVTKGLGGKDAVSAWRYYIRQQQKQAKPAQAAA